MLIAGVYSNPAIEALIVIGFVIIVVVGLWRRNSNHE